MIKKNVEEFNKDVLENQGFIYTTNLKFSSIVSNKRISDEVKLKIAPGTKTIFDAGCGDGTYTQEIKNNFPDAHVLAADPSNEGIRIAQGKYQGIDFFILDLENNKAFDRFQNIIDVTVIRGVLHHMNNPVNGIQNISRITKKIIIVEPNGNNPILKVIEKTSKYHIEHEEQSFSTKTLKKWCLDNGFENIKVTYIGLVPFFFPTLFAKIIYFFQPLVEKLPIINKYFCAQIVLTANKLHDKK
jgi:SAM-dependent methyltransferase